MWKPLPHLCIIVFVLILYCVSYTSLSSSLSLLSHLSPPFSLLSFHSCPPFPLVCLLCGSDLKDIHNSQHRYLLASENQRPGHLSTAPMGSLTASPSSGSLSSPTGLQSVCSIQERIMSTPGGEEAIERLKVCAHQQSYRINPEWHDIIGK